MRAIDSISGPSRSPSTLPVVLRRNSAPTADISAPVASPCWSCSGVRRVVRPNERRTLPPPDHPTRLERDSFWPDLARNTRGARVV